jgi:3-hydroxybutyrate dehydrogenase
MSRVSLVTGSTSGIGLAIARKFAALHHHVAVHGFEPAEDVANLLAGLDAVGRGQIAYFRPTLPMGMKARHWPGK